MASAALATTSVTKRSILVNFGVFGHFGGTPPKTPNLTILAIFDHFGPPPPGGGIYQGPMPGTMPSFLPFSPAVAKLGAIVPHFNHHLSILSCHFLFSGSVEPEGEALRT